MESRVLDAESLFADPFLQLDDAAIGVLRVDGGSDTLRSSPRHGLVVKELDSGSAKYAHCLREIVESHAKVQKAPFARRRWVEARVGNEIEERFSDANRDERSSPPLALVEPLDGQPEKASIECERTIEIAHAQHEMIE
jgi:hypothetical protein